MDFRRSLQIAALKSVLNEGTAKSGTIVTSNDDNVCRRCRELHGMTVTLDQMRAMVSGEEPLLPYDVCESEGGCRCRISFVAPLSRDIFG